MKNLILIAALFFSLNLYSQDTNYRLSIFYSNGKSNPIGSYSASNHSNTKLDIAKPTNYGRSWNIGINMDIINEFALTFNISRSAFELDSIKFNKLHTGDINKSESLLEKHKYLNFKAGIIRRFRYKKFNFDPGFTFGINIYKYGFAEYYGKNSSNEYFVTNKYEYQTIPGLSSSIRLNTCYNFISSDNMDVGFHFLCELNYTNPNVFVIHEYSNKNEHIYNTEEYTFRQKTFFIYWGFGLSVQFKT